MLKGFSNVLLISTVFFATTLSACSSGQEVASLKLPNGMEVKHSRTRTHPGFSEYDRELVLLDGVGKSKKLLLEKDTSGGYPMNVHGDKSGRYLRISDALIFDYVIDLKEMKGYSTMKFGDVLYAGCPARAGIGPLDL